MEKKLTHENMKDLVTAAIVFVIGVLFCCSLAMGMSALSWLVGLSLMVAGVLYFANSFLRKRGIATMEGIVGAAVFAFGIFFIANNLANLIVAYIPWLLICVGSVVFIDAFLRKFLRKDANAAGFVAQLVVGAASLALGLCLRFISGFGDFTALILGILLIVYAVYLIVNIFLSHTPAAKKEQKKAPIETTAEPSSDASASSDAADTAEAPDAASGKKDKKA